MLEFLKGGMFRGHRTQILGMMVAFQAVVSFLIGDITLLELWDQVPQIGIGLGLVSLVSHKPEQSRAEDEPPTGV